MNDAIPPKLTWQVSLRVPHALLPMNATHVRCWLHFSHPLERHPCSGPVHSAGELLHTPQRISISMTTALLLNWANTLYGIG